ncbi:MAG TPA: TolC family protein [Vicinamibacterales bacterium]
MVAATLVAGLLAQQAQPLQQSSNPFFGSVPKGTVTAEALNLSAADAVQRALQANLGLLLQEETEAGAHGARWRALADLLPNVAASMRGSRQVINLEAYGFPAADPIVGPFNVFDARIAVSQPVIDLSALNEKRAADARQQAAKYGVRSARDLVVLVAVNLYLETVSAASRVESVHAQQQTSETLLTQAQDLKSAGLVAGIDVLRAQVQTQTQRQRAIAAENEYEKLKLQLKRAVGIPVGQTITLTDAMPYAPLPPPALEAAVQSALDQRPDYLAAKSQLEAAQATRQAARMALLPSLRLDGDWGAIGQTVAAAANTYSIAATVRVPIFDSGRITARRIESDSALRQREAELADMHGRIEYEVRSALLDLTAADQQVQAARTNTDLAGQQLQQARDRFGAGVADNLELTQAQEAVAAASDAYISALYAHNVAKASLAEALGIGEAAVTQYLGGPVLRSPREGGRQ